MISEKAKNRIDSLSKEELLDEINKGRTSVFQGKKFAYVKSRYKMLCDQEKEKKRQKDVKLKENQLELNREANWLSRVANRRTIIIIVVAILTLLVTLFNNQSK